MPSNSQKFSSGRQILCLVIGKFVALVIQFLLPMFLARFLDKNGYGIYAQFNMFEMLFVGIFNLTLASGIYYFYPRLEQRGIRPAVGNSILVYFVTSLIGFWLVYFTPCGRWIMGDSPVITYVPVIFFAVFCSMCSGLMIPVYVVTKDNGTALVYPVAEIVLRSLIVIAVAWFLGGIRGVIIGVAVARFLMACVVCAYMIWKSWNSPDPHWIDFRLLKSQLRYCLPFAMSAALGTVTGRLDKIICVSFLTTAEYAVYVIAFFGIPGIQQFYSAIGDVSLTGMSKCFKNNDCNGALSILKNLEYKAVSISFPIVLAVCVYADKIITLIYSEKYRESTPFFRVFIFSLLFEMLASGLIVRASGKTHVSLYTSLISSAIVIPTTFFCVKYYGAWGGIFSVMLGRLIQRFAYAFFEIKIVKSTWGDYLPYRKFFYIGVISVILVLPLFLLRWFVDLNIVFCAVLACAYIVLVYLLEMHFNVFIVDKHSAMDIIRRYMRRVHLA